VAVVAIDEKAIERFGQWPWPRARVADLVSRVADAKPAAMALDIFFAEPDRFSPAEIGKAIDLPPQLAAGLSRLESGDAVLGRALGRVPSALAVAGIDQDDPRYAGAPGGPPFRFLGGSERGLREWTGHLHNTPEVDAGAASHGLVSIDFEGGIARRMPFVARVGGHGLAGLGPELVRLGVGGGLELAPAAGGLLELRVGDYRVPLQPDGRAYVHFGRSDPSRFILASDILAGRVDLAPLEGKLVLVGFTGLGLQDFAVTPLGEQVPGVENHAQAAEAIVEERFLRRYAFAPRLEAAVMVALGLVILFVVPRSSAMRSAGALAAGVALVAAASAMAFHLGGLLFDPLSPALGAIIVFGLAQVGSLAEAQRQRQQLREQAARMAGELDAAKRIQMGLLPDPGVVFSSDPRVEVGALLEPARTVGGDFYDCFMLDDDRLFFVVADVSGKGLPASLFMASVKSVLKGMALTAGSLGAVLGRAQAEMQRENAESLFVTAIVGVLDLASGDLELANAGHEPAWIHPPGGRPRRFDAPGGPPLCVLDPFDYPTTQLRLAPREWILAISDGVTEAMNPAGAFFGRERLATTLGWLGDDADAGAIVDRVRDDVKRFSAGAEPADDLTLLAIRWRGGAGRTPVPEPSGR
jgi:serine phosphatase RsbU (regulator of sigma subunit)/CHASE2 domain-containing sensor protein